MSKIKKHSLLIFMAMLILLVIPMSFAADVSADTNATFQANDAGVNEIGLNEIDDIQTADELETEISQSDESVLSATRYDYESTPTVNGESSVNYVSGSSTIVNVAVESDYLSDMSYESVYAWINGEGTNNRYLINGVKGSASSFTFDLQKISDKLNEGTNSITFHVTPSVITDLTWDTNYMFNPLTVIVGGSSPSLSDPELTVPSTLDVEVGSTVNIGATQTGDGAISYVSGDSSIATVDSNGIVTGVGAGSTIITVSVPETSSYKDDSKDVTVTVSRKSTEIVCTSDSISLVYGEKLDVGDYGDWEAVIKSDGSTVWANVVFEVVDSSVVGYHDGYYDAYFEGLMVGSTTINASFAGNDEYAPSYKIVNVEVVPADASVSVDSDSLDLFVGGSSDVVATTSPDGLAVTFESDNVSVATVNADGKVVAVGEGTATVTVTVNDANYVANNATVTVTVKAVEPTIKYVSNATVNGNDNVQYLINDHADVLITVVSDYLDRFESYDKLYAWIGDVYKQINVMANEESATVDLKVLSDEFGFEEGQTYTIYFHPDVADLSYIGIAEGEYLFNPLTVEIIGTYTPEPTVVYTSTPKVGEETAVEYTIGEDTIVTVTVVYDESYGTNSGFSGKNMKLFINGDTMGVAIRDVAANATSFTINLADYITEEGNYNISFSPGDSTLSWVFYGVDNYIVELNNLTVTASEPAAPEYLYVVTPSVDSIDYVKGESTNVTFTIEYPDSFDFDYVDIAVFIDGSNWKSGVVDADSYDKVVTIDLKDFDDDLDVGTHTIVVRHTNDMYDTNWDELGPSDCQFNVLTVNVTEKVKETPTIDITADGVVYGSPLVVNIAGVDGEYTVTVGDKTKNVTVADGIGSVEFTDLAAGSYDVVASFAGDDNYNEASANVAVKVAKAAPEISIIADNIVYGDDLIVTVNVSGDISRRVEVLVGNESKYAIIKDGTGSVKFSGLTVGTYDIFASYHGDANNVKVSVESTVKVTKATPVITISAKNIKLGEDLVVNITADGNISRRVSVTVGDMSKLVSIKDGKGSATFAGLAVGTYTINAAYFGDANNGKVSVESTVKVNRGPADITITANPVSYGESAVIEIQLPSDITRRVNVTVENQSQLVSLTNGSASVAFDGLTVGTHEVTVTYNGDSNYLKSSEIGTVKVNKATPDIQISANNITEGETLVVEVQIPADATKRPFIVIDGDTDGGKYATMRNGTGLIKFTGLTAGTHEITVTYAGDVNYKKTSTTLTAVVE